MSWFRALGSLVVLAAACGCAGRARGVVRLVDGREVPGRPIRAEAYALYARAVFLEASGELDRALTVYERVLDFDPWSVQAWTRIGALRCAGDPVAADQAFAEGARIDDEYEPLWRERAVCFLKSGEVKRARRAALRAIELDPNREETSLLVVQVHEAAKDVGEARRWLDALLQRSPSSPTAWRAAQDYAWRHEDRALARRARWMLQRLRPGSVPPPSPSEARDAIDRALLAYDLEAARAVAVVGQVPPAEVALRAAALGRPKLAQAQAQLVLDANPRDADAWVAGLVAADLDRDRGRLESLTTALASDPTPMSSLAARLLVDLLSRTLGSEVAAAWSLNYGPLPEPADRLEREVAGRVDPPELARASR